MSRFQLYNSYVLSVWPGRLALLLSPVVGPDKLGAQGGGGGARTEGAGQGPCQGTSVSGISQALTAVH